MEEQAFVVGDVLKTINEMYSLGVNNNDTVSSKEVLTSNNSQYDNKMEIASKKIKESGKAKIIIENAVNKLSMQYPDVTMILKALGKNEENINERRFHAP